MNLLINTGFYSKKTSNSQIGFQAGMSLRLIDPDGVPLVNDTSGYSINYDLTPDITKANLLGHELKHSAVGSMGGETSYKIEVDELRKTGESYYTPNLISPGPLVIENQVVGNLIKAASSIAPAICIPGEQEQLAPSVKDKEYFKNSCYSAARGIVDLVARNDPTIDTTPGKIQRLTDEYANELERRSLESAKLMLAQLPPNAVTDFQEQQIKSGKDSVEYPSLLGVYAQGRIMERQVQIDDDYGLTFGLTSDQVDTLNQLMKDGKEHNLEITKILQTERKHGA